MPPELFYNPQLKPGAALMNCPACGVDVSLRSHVQCHNCGAEIELIQRIH